MKNSFAPIFTSMLDSSIWGEPYHVRILWTAMLALQDSDHVVRFNAYQLSRRANITEKEALDGLKVLSSPDQRRQEKQPFDGRRIEKRDDGWFILNGQRFEEQMRLVSRRAYNARKQREYRNNKRAFQDNALPGERAAVMAENNGATQAQTDHITSDALRNQVEDE